MDELRNLQVLLAIERCGSLTAAARSVGLSTPAVSKTVARLEQQLGVRLFHRNTRRLAATTAAQRFFETLSQALAQLQQGADELRQSGGEASGLVRMCVNAAVGKGLVLPLLEGFFTLHPKVRLELHFDDRRRDLLRDGFDMGILHGRPVDKGHMSHPLCVLPLVLVASPAYLARRGVPAHPDDLPQHDCITLRNQAGGVAHWRFVPARRRAPAQPVVISPCGPLMVAEQYDAVVDAAVAGLGITVAFAHSVAGLLERGELHCLLPRWQVMADGAEDNTLHLSHAQSRHVAFAARQLAEYLQPRLQAAQRPPFDARRYAP